MFSKTKSDVIIGPYITMSFLARPRTIDLQLSLVRLLYKKVLLLNLIQMWNSLFEADKTASEEKLLRIEEKHVDDLSHSLVNILCIFAPVPCSTRVNQVWKGRRSDSFVLERLSTVQIGQQVFRCSFRRSTDWKAQV